MLIDYTITRKDLEAVLFVGEDNDKGAYVSVNGNTALRSDELLVSKEMYAKLQEDFYSHKEAESITYKVKTDSQNIVERMDLKYTSQVFDVEALAAKMEKEGYSDRYEFTRDGKEAVQTYYPTKIKGVELSVVECDGVREMSLVDGSRAKIKGREMLSCGEAFGLLLKTDIPLASELMKDGRRSGPVRMRIDAAKAVKDAVKRYGIDGFQTTKNDTLGYMPASVEKTKWAAKNGVKVVTNNEWEKASAHIPPLPDTRRFCYHYGLAGGKFSKVNAIGKGLGIEPMSHKSFAIAMNSFRKNLSELQNGPQTSYQTKFFKNYGLEIEGLSFLDARKAMCEVLRDKEYITERQFEYLTRGSAQRAKDGNDLAYNGKDMPLNLPYEIYTGKVESPEKAQSLMREYISEEIYLQKVSAIESPTLVDERTRVVERKEHLSMGDDKAVLNHGDVLGGLAFVCRDYKRRTGTFDGAEKPMCDALIEGMMHFMYEHKADTRIPLKYVAGDTLTGKMETLGRLVAEVLPKKMSPEFKDGMVQYLKERYQERAEVYRQRDEKSAEKGKEKLEKVKKAKSKSAETPKPEGIEM